LSADNPTTVQQLIGAWQLRSWTIADQRGLHRPFGDTPTGLLIYSADGHMTACIARTDRAALPGSKPRDADDAQLAAAMLSFFCYAGRWRLEDEVVIHDVQLALNPAMVGTSQRRTLTLAGRSSTDAVLTLSADEQTARGVRLNQLVWERRGE
jgi:hypothetical protein